MPKADGKRIATTKVQKNRTAPLPVSFREAEGVEPGDEIEWYVDGGEWVLRPAEDTDE